MELTREEAIRLHRELWGWLAENPMKTKQEWPEWGLYPGMRAGDLPCFALFEADGGAWRIEAMKRIKAYLEDNLKEIENVVVLG